MITKAASIGFVQVVHSLLDLQYLAQSHIINDNQCCKILAALEEFHIYKHQITDAVLHRGGKRQCP